MILYHKLRLNPKHPWHFRRPKHPIWQQDLRAIIPLLRGDNPHAHRRLRLFDPSDIVSLIELDRLVILLNDKHPLILDDAPIELNDSLVIREWRQYLDAFLSIDAYNVHLKDWAHKAPDDIAEPRNNLGELGVLLFRSHILIVPWIIRNPVTQSIPRFNNAAMNKPWATICSHCGCHATIIQLEAANYQDLWGNPIKGDLMQCTACDWTFTVEIVAAV